VSASLWTKAHFRPDAVSQLDLKRTFNRSQ
jgi:hypothetical protein